MLKRELPDSQELLETFLCNTRCVVTGHTVVFCPCSVILLCSRNSSGRGIGGASLDRHWFSHPIPGPVPLVCSPSIQTVRQNWMLLATTEWKIRAVKGVRGRTGQKPTSLIILIYILIIFMYNSHNIHIHILCSIKSVKLFQTKWTASYINLNESLGLIIKNSQMQMQGS